MQVTLEHVPHTYQEGSPFQSTAIRDISMTIREGEFLALIGHTGSGKSTLAQHINGLLKPTEGRVLLDGKDIHEKGCNKKEVRLQKVGLDPDAMEGRSPFELSGGQMRRVAMAGVLAMRPSILVLDEPAAGLDPQSREEMLQLIYDLHRQGATVVMISHSMDDVARFATRAVVMEQGAIAMEGTPEEIFTHAEQLEKMGLDVPSVCKLSLRLKELGVACPQDIFREDQAFDALLNLWKGEKAHGAQ